MVTLVLMRPAFRTAMYTASWVLSCVKGSSSCLAILTQQCTEVSRHSCYARNDEVDRLLTDLSATWYRRNVLMLCWMALSSPAIISEMCRGHSVLTTSQFTVAIQEGSDSFFFSFSAAHTRIARVRCCFAMTNGLCSETGCDCHILKRMSHGSFFDANCNRPPLK